MKFTDRDELSREAERLMPLRRLMEQHGDVPDKGRNEFKSCPFCGEDGCAGLYQDKRIGRELFKCHHTSCSTGTKTLNEIAYLKAKHGISGAQAFWDWVKAAGIDVDQAKRDIGAAPGGTRRPESRKKRSEPAHPDDEPPPGPTDVYAEACSRELEAETLTMDPDADAPAPLDPSPSPEPDAFPESGRHPAGDAADPPPATPTEPGDIKAPAASGSGPSASAIPRLGDSPRLALRRFYELAAELPEREQRRLWLDRGLTPETIKAAGLKWSCAANAAVIEGMQAEFIPTAMERAGLLTSDPRSSTGRLQPNNQLCGWGPTGKKTPDGKDQWAEINPVIIPFFDPKRELLTLRCHKCSLPRALPQLYLALPDRPVANPKWVVVCESEFKALAVRQALPGEAMVCGLCGISNAGNWFVMDTLTKWLRDMLLPTDGKVIVVYDNEEKGNPDLPGYNPDERKRHDSIVWARYLARQLYRGGVPTLVGLLPNEWRNAKGKADWDGALADLIAASGITNQAPWPEEPAQIWAAVADGVAEDFRQVLRQSVPEKQVNEIARLGTAAHMAVERKLEWLSHEPNIKTGSNSHHGEEQRTADRLRACAVELRRREQLRKAGEELKGPEAITFGLAAEAVIGTWFSLADHYEDMRGRMYYLKPSMETRSRGNPVAHDDGSNTVTNWRLRRSDASSAGDLEFSWACATAAKGWPAKASDFTIAPKFSLRKTDGEFWRMCVIHSIHGLHRRGEPSGLIAIPSEALSSTDRFRRRLSVAGNYTFHEGNTTLQLLCEDLNHALAGNHVREVAVHGWHDASGLWFTADCAFTSDGQVVLPNKYDVFWHQGHGWRLAVDILTGDYVDCDKSPQPMHHGACRMQPDQVLVRQGVNGDTTFHLERLPEGKTFVTEQDPAVLRDLYREVRRRLCDTLGGEDGALALAMIVMSAAGPEIYRRYNFISGLCCNGEHGHGKSTIGLWLMALWGYRITGGVDLKKTSIAGLHVAGQQYCYQPVWLEEFNARDQASEVEESLKGWFDRTGGSKVGASRTVQAVALVTGQTSFIKPATRERFVQILVHQGQRRRNPDGTQINHIEWMRDHLPMFFALGRHVLLHRNRFATIVLERMHEWITDDTMRNLKDRPRSVYASAWASLRALEALLDYQPTEEEEDRYFHHLFQHCSQAVQETRQRTEVDAWLANLLIAFQRRRFQEDGADDLHKAFKIELVNRVSTQAPGASNQKDWFSWRLYLNPDLVLRIVRQELRGAGEEMPLDKGDVRAQLGQRPCWVPFKKTSHFKGAGTIRPWCLDLDKLPDLGYQSAGDDEVKAAHEAHVQAVIKRDGQMAADPNDYWWEDPRRGGYFEIVRALCPKAHTIQNEDGSLTLEGID